MSCTVAVIGETVIDRYIHTAGHATDHVGGSPANVARWLAAAGLATTFYTELGEDHLGKEAAAVLRRSGVVVEAQLTPSSNLATVTLDENGVPSYDFRVGWTWRPTAQVVHSISTAQHVHLGSLGSWTRPGSAEALRACAHAVSAGATVSFDLNARPALMTNEETVRSDIMACLRHATIAKASEDDLLWYAPGTEPDSLTRQWIGDGAQVVAVTRGALGAMVRSATTCLNPVAHRVDVIDTVGAGDAWMAGFLMGWLTSTSGEDARLERAARLAETCATWAVQHAGPTVASPALVRDWLSAQAKP